ncbi:MAG: copper-binding protein [Propionivibrio sp.]
MKTAFSVTLAAAVALTSLTSLSAFAASEHGGHGDMAGMHEQSAAPMSIAMVEGTVKKVDKAGGKVTLAHGPLTNLGMNMPMTMAFRVKEASWLDQMKVGDKIRFVAEDAGGTLTIVQFEPAR